MAIASPRISSQEDCFQRPLQRRLEEYGNQYGDITITGNANVVLGNVSHHHDDGGSLEPDEETRRKVSLFALAMADV